MKVFKKILIGIFAVAIIAAVAFLLIKYLSPEKPCDHEYEDGVCIHCEELTLDAFEFTYLEDSDSYSVRLKDGYHLKNKLIIPSAYNGKPVTAIDDFGFSRVDKDYFTENSDVSYLDTDLAITIPASINHIGEGAFVTWSLTSITIKGRNTRYYSKGNCLIDKENSAVIAAGKDFTIPQGITTIGNYAFCEHENLYKLALPDSVTTIGKYAFAKCREISSIAIGSGLATIGEGAFDHCYNVHVIYNNSSLDLEIGKANENGNIAYYAKALVEGGSVTYCENDGYEYILKNDFLFRYNTRYSQNRHELICYSGNEETVTLPLHINDNDYTIYKMCGVVNVIIPEGFTTISDYAFYGCSSLTSVVIPDSVTSIGHYAFSRCSSLTSVVIPYSVTSIGDYAFWSCNSLARIEIPYGVTSIGANAFESCSRLTSVVIPDSVTSIGEGAFQNCDSITGVVIPYRVTSIGANAFEGCSSLTSIDVDESNEYFKSIEGNLYSKDGRTLIQYAAGKEDATFEIPYGVTSIGDFALAECNILTSVVIPDSVTSVGIGAFYICRNLSSVVISDSITSISDYAFYACYNLTGIVIPNSVTSIGEGAFQYCDSITGVVIPDSVTSIGDDAFSNCESLANVVIGESVEFIGDCAFSYCHTSKIRSSDGNRMPIFISAPYDFYDYTGITIEVCGDNPYYKSIDGSLYSKDGRTLIQYATAKTDTTFVIPDGVTTICEGAFNNCKSLTDVVIPDSVEFIGCNAFGNCNNLKSAEFENIEGWEVKVIIPSFFGQNKDFISSDLADPEKAAEYLRSTFSSSKWERK